MDWIDKIIDSSLNNKKGIKQIFAAFFSVILGLLIKQNRDLYPPKIDLKARFDIINISLYKTLDIVSIFIVPLLFYLWFVSYLKIIKKIEHNEIKKLLLIIWNVILLKFILFFSYNFLSANYWPFIRQQVRGFLGMEFIGITAISIVYLILLLWISYADTFKIFFSKKYNVLILPFYLVICMWAYSSEIFKFFWSFLICSKSQ